MKHLSSDPKIQNILAIAEAIKVVISYQDALPSLQGFADRIAQLPGQPILRFVEDQDPENKYDLRLFADGNVSDEQEEAIAALREDLDSSGELREIADAVAIIEEGFFDFRIDPQTYKDEITAFAIERISKSVELISRADIPSPTEIRNIASSLLPAAIGQTLTDRQLEELLAQSSAAIVDEVEVCFPRIDNADEWDKEEGHKGLVLIWGEDEKVVELSDAIITLDNSGNITIVEACGTETQLRLLYAPNRNAMLNACTT